MSFKGLPAYVFHVLKPEMHHGIDGSTNSRVANLHAADVTGSLMPTLIYVFIHIQGGVRAGAECCSHLCSPPNSSQLRCTRAGKQSHLRLRALTLNPKPPVTPTVGTNRYVVVNVDGKKEAVTLLIGANRCPNLSS